MRNVLANDFLNGKSFLKHRKSIVKEIIKQSKKITSVLPPIPELEKEYESMLAQGAEDKGGNFWYPYIGSGIGNGAYVELADGSVKLDLISGIGVHYLGHSNHAIILNSLNGAVVNTVHNGHLQQNEDSIKLMHSMLSLANMSNHYKKFAHCFMSTSGAMANENALKIAFQKKPGADRILCFEKCFAGRSLATACMTDKASNRVGLPTALNVDYVPFAGYDCVSKLKEIIDRFPGKHAAMCLELVQGEGGYNTSEASRFLEIAKVLKENNIAFWVDEIQTFGRTLRPFAFQHYKLEDAVDIITVGKASQVCATIFTKDFKPKPGLLSQTFTSTSVAIKTSQYIMDYISRNHDKIFLMDGLIPTMRNNFENHFKNLHSQYGTNIIKSEVKGLGGMIAVTMFDGNLEKTVKFTKMLFKKGVISFVAGKGCRSVVRFLPPVNIKKEQIDEAMKIFEDTLKEFV
jgi:acetylornithine aminotransferase